METETEVKTNDKGNESGNNGGTKGEGSNASPDSVGGSLGGGGTSGGAGGGEQASGGGGQGGGQASGGEPKADRKNDLLQRVRAKRSNGQRDASRNPDGASNADSKGNGGGLPGSERGVKGDPGTKPRANRDTGRGGDKSDDGNGGASEITQGNESGRLKPNSKDTAFPAPQGTSTKPQGVNIKGVDKIKALAEKAAQADPPKLKFSWDEKPLSNKEGEEVLPKVRGLLEFVFRHMDKGISISNRNRMEAHIWTEIDNEDLDIIAGHLVEMGKASKIVATAVRRMTNSYRLLQIGLITLPKFIQTYQFYAENGGFMLGAPAARKA